MPGQKSNSALFVAVVALLIAVGTAAFVIYVQMTTTEQAVIDRIAERARQIDGKVESVKGILLKMLDEVSTVLLFPFLMERDIIFHV